MSVRSAEWERISENHPLRCPGKRVRRLLVAIVLPVLWVSFACGGGTSTPQVSQNPGPGSPSPNPGPPPGPAGQGIPPEYFGLDVFTTVFSGTPWPSFSFGSLRLWDSGTSWLKINIGDGVYDFSQLDAWLQTAQQQGVKDILYTFAETPAWASSNPTDQTCVDPSSPPGACDPPSDLNVDGTGADQIWKNFVTAIVTHNQQSSFAHITAWEMWNEPTIPKEWNGTVAQLARMSQDACTIIKTADPSALVTTPAPVTTSVITSAEWMSQYITATQTFSSTVCPAPAANVVTFHGYLAGTGTSDPEKILDTITSMVSLQQATPGVSSTPLWDTESDWGRNGNLPNPDLDAAFLARFYLLQWSGGVARLYWYEYGNTDFGTIWSGGSLNQAGTAYRFVHDWMTGATLTSPCSNGGTVWTCNFTKPGRIKEQAVWDSAQTCNNGSCTASAYAPDSVYTSYQNVAGEVFTFTSGSEVQIGAKPILLFTQ